ncbi:MAG: hypothetical protein ABI169_08155 [Chitinophagaceae bacterium]
MSTKSLYFGLAIIILVASCKQNDPQVNAPRIPVSDQRLIDAATAKVGSYFVYQDSATGVTDSFGVISFTDNYYYSGIDNSYFENIGYLAVNDTIAGTFPPRISIGARASGVELSIWTHGFLGTGAAVFFPFPGIGNVQLNDATGTGIRFLPKFSENGHNYINVYEVIAHDRQIHSEVWIHSWFSILDGLVKFRVFDTSKSTTYYLLRSKIIK